MHNKAPKCRFFWQHLAAGWQQDAAELRQSEPSFRVRREDASRNLIAASGAAATAQVTLRLTPSQLADLDRYCAERKMSRSQVARRALKAHFRKRAGRPKR